MLGDGSPRKQRAMPASTWERDRVSFTLVLWD